MSIFGRTFRLLFCLGFLETIRAEAVNFQGLFWWRPQLYNIVDGMVNCLAVLFIQASAAMVATLLLLSTESLLLSALELPAHALGDTT